MDRVDESHELEREPSLGWRRDLRSKLLDGLLPAAALYLLFRVVVYGLAPINGLFGRPGLLVYIVGLLGVAMFSLQHALLTRLPEPTRAWYGMAGGGLAWAVTEISVLLQGSPPPLLSEWIGLIMVWLVIVLLWRGNLGVGGRFFATAYAANWSGSLLLSALDAAAKFNSVLMLAYRGLSVLSAAGALVLLGWVLVRSQRRIDRIWASLCIVLLSAGAVYGLGGSLF